MQKFKSIFDLKKKLVVLALGPHADDIELGCGATLLYLRKKYEAIIHYVVFCDHFLTRNHKFNRLEEIRKSSDMLLNHSRNKKHKFECWAFPDRRFPNEWQNIQERIAKLKNDTNPDLIFTPRLDDNHQDHKIVAEAAQREFRHGQALMYYEIKQFGQDQFQPNVFVDVSQPSNYRNKEYIKFYKKIGGKDTFAHWKVFILHKCMKSQLKKPFLNTELLLGQMRFRGMQVSPEVDYAEAFEGRILI